MYGKTFGPKNAHGDSPSFKRTFFVLMTQKAKVDRGPRRAQEKLRQQFIGWEGQKQLLQK